jgi:hypothetical protein
MNEAGAEVVEERRGEECRTQNASRKSQVAEPWLLIAERGGNCGYACLVPLVFVIVLASLRLAVPVRTLIRAIMMSERTGSSYPVFSGRHRAGRL